MRIERIGCFLSELKLFLDQLGLHNKLSPAIMGESAA